MVGTKNVYFFANSSEVANTAEVSVRGEFETLEVWDPMTGERKALDVTVKDGMTSFTLSLDKISSCFVVEPVDPIAK